jgi:S-adenosylmethionine-diacylglycerol 3-amino-3-carboxypropyl transferase
MVVTSLETPDAWAQEAARLPLAFSQVREDPSLDAAVLSQVGPNARVFMIASGGDTAAALMASGHASHMQVVDINPAQLALTRLKLALLRAVPAERLAILGHQSMPPEARAKALGDLKDELGLRSDVFGPTELVARLGPDNAGRYEILFHHLREHLEERREDLRELLALEDPTEQTRRIAPDTQLGQAIDRAFDSVMRLDNLVRLFGEEATRNSCVSFARHFAARTRHAFATLPARTNPFLAQLLHGTFFNGYAYDWLSYPAPRKWPEITYSCSTAVEALAALPCSSVDFLHLSNILDWLSPEAAAMTLAHAWKALGPGGRTIIRQLNSTLDIPAFEPRFTWRADESEALHRQDRSFFYRALFIGSKSPG